MNNIAKDITITIAGMGDYKLTPVEVKPRTKTLSTVTKLSSRRSDKTAPIFVEAVPKDEMVSSAKLFLDVTDVPSSRVKVCSHCGKLFIVNSPNQKYCLGCSLDVKRARWREWYARAKAANSNPRTTVTIDL